MLSSCCWTYSALLLWFSPLTENEPIYWKQKWAALWQNQQCGCAPSEDSDQPGHLPSLIKVFAVCMKKAWVLSYVMSRQWRHWSDWAEAQADPSLCWAHSHFVGFVMRRLKPVMWTVKQEKIRKQRKHQISIKGKTWSETWLTGHSQRFWTP